MAGHLEFCHLKFGHLGFSHLSISSQTHSHLLRLVPIICIKKLHSFIVTQLDDGSHLEFCHVGFRHYHVWIQTPCYLLSDSLKNTLTPLWLWLKLIQSDSNSFILTYTWWWPGILNSAILHLAILDSVILVFPLKLTHTCQDWAPQFAHTKLHLFIVTQLDDGSHLEFCHVGFTLPSWIQTPCYLLSDSLKNTLPPLSK